MLVLMITWQDVVHVLIIYFVVQIQYYIMQRKVICTAFVQTVAFVSETCLF